MLFLVFAFFSHFGKFIFEEKSLDVIFSCCKNANCGCHMQERKYLFEKKPETFRTHLKRFTGLLADLPFPGLLVALVADQHDRDPVHRTLDLDIGKKRMRATEPTRTMSTKRLPNESPIFNLFTTV